MNLTRGCGWGSIDTGGVCVDGGVCGQGCGQKGVHPPHNPLKMAIEAGCTHPT